MKALKKIKNQNGKIVDVLEFPDEYMTRHTIDAVLSSWVEIEIKRERERACNILKSYITYSSSFEEDELNELLNEILKKIQWKEAK